MVVIHKCVYLHISINKKDMKTEIKRLHELAGVLLVMIDDEIKRLEIKEKNYRQWCHFSSREWLEKYEHDIDICDRAIKRLKESYFKTINKIAEHGKAN